MARGEVEKLVERFGSIVAEEASSTIEPGEAFTLLGPSGAGKTTIRILLTLLPPTSKTVRVARCGAARFLILFVESSALSRRRAQRIPH
ncbi:ATP-binding cassette domain-containing protein [Thermomicrobium sp.]